MMNNLRNEEAKEQSDKYKNIRLYLIALLIILLFITIAVIIIAAMLNIKRILKNDKEDDEYEEDYSYDDPDESEYIEYDHINLEQRDSNSSNENHEKSIDDMTDAELYQSYLKELNKSIGGQQPKYEYSHKCSDNTQTFTIKKTYKK